jgi:hypothetical protein
MSSKKVELRHSLIIQCTAGIRRERTAPIVRPPTKAIPRVQIAPAAGHGCKKAAVERHPYLGRKKAAIANHCEKVNDFGVTIQSQHFAVSWQFGTWWEYQDSFRHAGIERRQRRGG